MQVLDLGRKGYQPVWDLQLEIHKDRVAGRREDTLILVEHEPVITMGKSGDVKNLLISPERLKEKGVDFYRIERGGDVTYHGPGQLVGYPIFEIKSGFAGIRPFIRSIEEVVIKTLDHFGLKGRRGGHPGVWVGDEKILSIGLAVRRWVSFHGFAFNVNNKPDDFSYINPCGHVGMKLTSIKNVLNKPVKMSAVKDEIVDNFQAVIDAKTDLVKN